jgi:hypothetical protein
MYAFLLVYEFFRVVRNYGSITVLSCIFDSRNITRRHCQPPYQFQAMITKIIFVNQVFLQIKLLWEKLLIHSTVVQKSYIHSGLFISE